MLVNSKLETGPVIPPLILMRIFEFIAGVCFFSVECNSTILPLVISLFKSFVWKLRSPHQLHLCNMTHKMLHCFLMQHFDQLHVNAFQSLMDYKMKTKAGKCPKTSNAPYQLDLCGLQISF